MNVLVYGAGAMGSLLAAFLAGKHEVTIVGRAPHVEAIRRDGLKVEGVRTMTVPLEARTDLDGSESPDLVLLTVKSYDTAAAIERLKSVVGAKTILVTCQNGLGNFEALRDAFPQNPVMAATLTYGASLIAPGRVNYAGKGEVLVGGTPQQLDVAGKLGRLFREAGLNALGLPEIRGHVWQKAIVNAAINPLSALTGRTNGELLDDPRLVERMKTVAREAAAVARAQKIQLPERDPFTVVQRVAQATAKNRSSMLQDVERGRKTEIDSITGVIVEAGRKVGIPTPENEALLKAVKERVGRN